MKIQDIFKLPNTKGKSKLFNKIMRKYGIPKEDSKELKNNIDNFSSGGGEEFEYLDVSNESVYGIDVLAIATLECKGVSDTISMVAPAVNVQPFVEAMGITITQLKVDFNTLIVMNREGTITKQTALEMLLSRGITQDNLAAIPRITKEEFYKLD